MDQQIPADPHAEIRQEVAKLGACFPGEYWRNLDQQRAYPTEFVRAPTQAGYLAALIPEEYGGAGLTLSAAATRLAWKPERRRLPLSPSVWLPSAGLHRTRIVRIVRK